MNKIVLVLCITVICCFKVVFPQSGDRYAQNLPSFTPSSPQASAIIQYQNYPIDYRTGTPDIEIPLFTIDTKIGRIPFALSYHPGRLKSSDLTGPVGYGWTLTPNIGISRTINGKDDEKYMPIAPGDMSYGTLQGLANPLSSIEEELDDYYYSLLNKSGSFLRHNQKDGFVTNPYEPIVISKKGGWGGNDYTIIDEKGVIYKFGSNQPSTSSSENVEYTLSSSFHDFSGFNNVAAVSWKITEITAADQSESIKFKYNKPVRWTMPILTYQYKIRQYNRFLVTSEFDFIGAAPIGGNKYLSTSYTTIRKTGYNYGGSVSGWKKLKLGGGSAPSFISANKAWNSVFDIRPERLIYSDYGPSDSYLSLSETNLNDDCRSGVNGDIWDSNLISTRSIDEILVSEIVFNTGKIVFSYDNNRLKNITIYSKLNEIYTPVKKIKLYQQVIAYSNDLFSINTGGNLNYRAILDSITISDMNELQKNVYKIDYAKLSSNALGLYTGNIGLDMWGNIDGSDINGFNGDKVPTMDITLSDCSALSPWKTDACSSFPAPNTSFPKYTFIIGSKQLQPLHSSSSTGNNTNSGLPSYLIKRIVYPTGGTAEFEFEKNQFKLSYDNSDTYGTGVRIKSIKYKSELGEDSLTRNFRYGSSENGLGHIKFIPSRSDFISSQYFYESYTSASDVQKVITISANPYSDLLFNGGAAVRYTQVTEYIGTPNKNVGKTVYTYSNPQQLYRIPYLPLGKKQREDWRYNLLSSVAQYEFSGNNYNLIQKKVYDYVIFNKEVLKSASASPRIVSLVGQNLSAQHSPTEIFFYDIQTINTGAQKTLRIIDSIFNENMTPITTNTWFKHDPVTLQIINETTVNSVKDTLVTDYKYPRDFLTQSPYNKMVSHNIISPIIELSQKKNNKLLQSDIVQFKNWQGSHFAPMLHLKRYFSNDVDTILSTTAYDDKGNVLEQTKFKGIKEVYLWGYNGNYPVARIIGSDYSTVNSLVGQTQIDNVINNEEDLRNLLNTLRTALPSAQVNTYTYKPLIGMTSKTDARGITEYYKYDGMQRLQAILDHLNNVNRTFDYHYRSN